MNTYAPCPKCGGTNAEKLRFTWWGGLLGPKLLTHVQCPGCGMKYNGKSGKDNTTNIVIYSIVMIVLAFGLMVLMFVVFGMLLMARR